MEKAPDGSDSTEDWLRGIHSGRAGRMKEWTGTLDKEPGRRRLDVGEPHGRRSLRRDVQTKVCPPCSITPTIAHMHSMSVMEAHCRFDGIFHFQPKYQE